MAKRELELSELGDKGYMVPCWDGTAEGIRRYINHIDEAKELGIFTKDAELIYASLCRSQRPDIYSMLDAGTKADIKKFAIFMADQFGESQNELKRKFQTLKQGENECEMTFFNRCQQNYFAARSLKRVPTGTGFTNDHKEDISLVFISGLRYSEVRKSLLTRIDEVEFAKLGRVAKRISLNLRELNNRIYHVGGPDQEKNKRYGESVFRIREDRDRIYHSD